MLDQVPWTIRHPNAALALLFVALIVAFTSLWVALIQRRLRRRAKAELLLVGELVSETKQPSDGTLVVMRGHLVGTRQDKPLPPGTPLLAPQGALRVQLDFGLSLERGKNGRVALVGPYQVLLGAREGLPPGRGQRVLRVGDEVFVRGRWSVQKVETATYRDLVVKGAVVPSVDELELVFVGTPMALGLAEAALAKGLAWGAFFGAVLMSFGAYAVLEIGYTLNTDAHVLPIAKFAYMSPFLRSNVATFVREHAPLLHARDFDLASQWAAIESYLDQNQECLGTLDNLRQTGRIESEARLGSICGGTSSKRRAADAFMLLGEYQSAVQLLQSAPPPASPIRGIPDAQLDLVAHLVTKDWAQAAKLLRKHGHPILRPSEEQCLALSLEARAGSFLSRDKLKSEAQILITCALLEADLLEGTDRITFIDKIPREMMNDEHRSLGEDNIFRRLRAEVDPTNPLFTYVEPTQGSIFGLWSDSSRSDVMPPIDLEILKKFHEKHVEKPDLVEDYARLETALAQFFALVGDEPEAKRLSDLALEHISAINKKNSVLAFAQAAIAVRRDDPNALEYILRAEAIKEGRHFSRFPYLRWVHDMRNGAWPENSHLFNYETGSQESIDAILRGSGKDVLAHSPPGSFLELMILGGRRIKTDREMLIEKVRYYDPECLVKRCPLKMLANRAAMHAIAIRELRHAEGGQKADLEALEERARKLRAPLLQRELAVILMLVERY